jgi:hypothetical protein
MRLLKTAIHPDIPPEDILPGSNLTIVTRHAARGIVIKGESILLLYTQRYHDYSLPGGGIDNIKAFARYDEYRPWYKSNADVIHK